MQKGRRKYLKVSVLRWRKRNVNPKGEKVNVAVELSYILQERRRDKPWLPNPSSNPNQNRKKQNEDEKRAISRIENATRTTQCPPQRFWNPSTEMKKEEKSYSVATTCQQLCHMLANYTKAKMTKKPTNMPRVKLLGRGKTGFSRGFFSTIFC